MRTTLFDMPMMSDAKKAVRAAIYTRVSDPKYVDSSAPSLQVQSDACRRYVEDRRALGWEVVSTRFDDAGQSGKSADRPALKLLTQQIRDSLVDVIVVHKVDRLSRSLFDFAQMLRFFEMNDVSFVSVTQDFSTQTSMGRLALNILMSFAEFEREMIVERTREAIDALKRKGRWTSGHCPFGYRLENKMLVVAEQEASVVRAIFCMYLEERSAADIANRLNSKGSRYTSDPPRRWTKQSVFAVLKNPVYSGYLRHRGGLLPGIHQQLVDRAAFRKVQAIAARRAPRRRKARSAEKKVDILTGMVFCAVCKRKYIPVRGRKLGREYRYYRCMTRDKEGSKGCKGGQVSAEALEKLVVDEVAASISSESRRAKILATLRSRASSFATTLDNEISDLSQDLETLRKREKELWDMFNQDSHCDIGIYNLELQHVFRVAGQKEKDLLFAREKRERLKDAQERHDHLEHVFCNWGTVWKRLRRPLKAKLLRSFGLKVQLNRTSGTIEAWFGAGALGCDKDGEKGNELFSKSYHLRRDNGAVTFVERTPQSRTKRPAKIALILARAHALFTLLHYGEYDGFSKLADSLGVSRARLSQLVGLTLLAPDIQHQILHLTHDETRPRSITEHSLRAVTKEKDWTRQRLSWRKLLEELVVVDRDHRHRNRIGPL